MWNKLSHINLVIDPFSILLGITAVTIGHWVGYLAAGASLIYNGIRITEWAIKKYKKNG